MTLERTNEIPALCGICSAGCGVIVTCDGEERISAVRADERSEPGIICKLGEHSMEIVYSEDRGSVFFGENVRARSINGMTRKVRMNFTFSQMTGNFGTGFVLGNFTRMRAHLDNR